MGEGAKRVRAGVSGSLYVGLAVPALASLETLLRQEDHVHRGVKVLLLLPMSSNDITEKETKRINKWKPLEYIAGLNAVL